MCLTAFGSLRIVARYVNLPTWLPMEQLIGCAGISWKFILRVKAEYNNRYTTAQCIENFLKRSSPNSIRCNIAYTPWPLACCPPLFTSFTSATLHLVVRLLSHFQRTRTRQSRSLEDCGSILLAADTEEPNWFLITSRFNPTYIASLFIFRLSAREPQWAIWRGDTGFDPVTSTLTAWRSSGLS